MDDTLVEWQEGYEEVALIEIPPQHARLEHDETLRFQPYHVSDEGFLPLGRLNRFRQAIYAHTQRTSNARYPFDAPTNTRVAVVGGVPVVSEQHWPWRAKDTMLRSTNAQPP